MKNRNLFLLIFALILCFSIGVTSSFFTKNELDPWYFSLRHPFWTPPGYVFSIVWPLLYTMIALSFWRVLILPKKINKSKALVAFSCQLFLNFTWSFSFFYLKSPLLGLMNISLLLGAIYWNIITFYPLSKSSGSLLIPYFIWVLYATTLNIGFLVMNQ